MSSRRDLDISFRSAKNEQNNFLSSSYLQTKTLSCGGSEVSENFSLQDKPIKVKTRWFKGSRDRGLRGVSLL